MIKTIKTLIAVAALSGTVGANTQAAGVTVNKGDTLWNISQVHSTSVENIKEWNNLYTDLIHPGDVLTIPQEKHYSVKDGDTLRDIARANNDTVKDIKEWNKISTDLIKPGTTLTIYENTDKKKTSVLKQKKAAVQVPASNSVAGSKINKVKKQPTKPIKKVTKANVKAVTLQKSGKKVINVKATAYTALCKGCSGVTRTGVNLKSNPNSKVISVDPKVIPLGSKVYVEGYGYATAADTGGAIKGNRIDVFIPTQSGAINFGAKQLKVTIIN